MPGSGGGAGAGKFDIFGTQHTIEQWRQMEQLEQQAKDLSFVVVSDLHLDKPQVTQPPCQRGGVTVSSEAVLC